MEQNGRIANFTNNTNLVLRWIIPNLPADVTVASAKFVVKLNETDANSAALINKTITSSNTDGVGQVEDVGTTNPAELRFDLTPTDTALLTPSIQYNYWCDVTLSTDEITTLEKGKIFSTQGSSHA